MRDVMFIGHREMFGKYVPGLPEDSALIRKLRQPYEAEERAKQKARERFSEMRS